MGSAAAQEQVYARLAWFLAGAYPGASKRKRIARDFDVSPDTAKGWLCGNAWPRQETFLRMRTKWGPAFIRFVYMEMDELDARVARLEREMRLEEARGAALVAVETARPVPSALPVAGGMGGEDATEVAAVSAAVAADKARRPV